MKKMICFMLAIMLLVFSGCGSKQNAPEETAKAEMPTVVYEAFFLDNEEILKLFAEVRGPEAPHAIMTQDFHVTTAFMPEQDMREFYGTEVTVHIYAYQDGEVTADDGKLTANEGFFCTVTTENPDMQDFIDHLEKNWHITGSYQDQGGAKYTEYLDLTGAREVEYTVKGHFGGYMSDGNIAFSPEQ